MYLAMFLDLYMYYFIYTSQGDNTSPKSYIYAGSTGVRTKS